MILNPGFLAHDVLGGMLWHMRGWMHARAVTCAGMHERCDWRAREGVRGGESAHPAGPWRECAAERARSLLACATVARCVRPQSTDVRGHNSVCLSLRPNHRASERFSGPEVECGCSSPRALPGLAQQASRLLCVHSGSAAMKLSHTF